jgi:hypothetical protein
MVEGKCPLLGKCVYFKEGAHEAGIYRQAFYAYDSEGDTHCNHIRKIIKGMLVDEFGWKVYDFADHHFPLTPVFCTSVCRPLKESVFLIADISKAVERDENGLNPNVMLEVGLALGLGKKVILISRDPIDDKVNASRPPTDLSGHIFYRFPSDFDSGVLHNAISEAVGEYYALDRFDLIDNMIDYYHVVSDVERKSVDIASVHGKLSIFTKPAPLVRHIADALSINGAMDPKLHDVYCHSHLTRTDEFINKLRSGSTIKEIYNKNAIERYVYGLSHKGITIPIDLMIESLQNFLSFIHYDGYQVGLTEDPIVQKYQILDSRIVVSHNFIGQRNKRIIAMYFSTREAVSKFQSDFDTLWNNAIIDKKSTIEWVNGMIGDLNKKGNI